ncbi:MAG: hypothetical protein IKN87_04595 [Bacilli bacterium]|nr:hypothetical protein [Bacilli bacterium]
MSNAEKNMNVLNYVSDLKEKNDGVISNEYKNVVKYSFTCGKLAVEKNYVPVSTLGEMIAMVPENMEAFTREHVESLDSVLDDAKKDYNDLKVMKMVEEDYEPKVRAKAA